MQQTALMLSAIAICIGFPTALLDMGMNGARYAGWAPYGLAMTFVGLAGVHWLT